MSTKQLFIFACILWTTNVVSAQTEFITIWNTEFCVSTPGKTEISYPGRGNYTLEIYKQGETTPLQTLSGTDQIIIKGLTAKTKYEIRVTSALNGLRGSSSIDIPALIDIAQWGTAPWSSMENAFSNARNMNMSATDLPVLSNVYNFSAMFQNCANFLGNASINDWDMGSATNLGSMFERASKFNQDLDKWDVSNVSLMPSMFLGASLFNKNIESWDVRNVTNISGMFSQAIAFNQPLNNWVTTNFWDVSGAFNGAISFNQPLDKWNTSKVQYMSSMFNEAHQFNQNINAWNVGIVYHFNYMFYGALAFNQPLNNWNTSNISSFAYMFTNARSFNQPLNNWNTGNVTNMNNMFRDATQLEFKERHQHECLI